jgi:hypothetical protein
VSQYGYSAINTSAHRTAPFFYCVAFWPCRSSRRIEKLSFFIFLWFLFFPFSKMFFGSETIQMKEKTPLSHYTQTGLQSERLPHPFHACL